MAENDDLQERAIWSKVSPDVESSINGINGKVVKRASKSISFKSSGTIFEIIIKKANSDENRG